MGIKKTYTIFTTIILAGRLALAQLSPGDLATPHAHLEGMSNCTQCHILGEKVSNDKCLKCHTELKKRLDLKQGYHSSSVIAGKECVSCHSDHHGRNFEMVRIIFEQFNHNETGYKLQGAHAKKDCKDCHKPEFITDPDAKKKKKTYLGVSRECLTCHTDYHRKTLSTDCVTCHNFEKFKPAPGFDHSKAKYKLLGKHQQVECLKCHKMEINGDEKFQVFTGVKFGNCNDCHQDVHKNQFGQNCVQCHTEESFHNVKGMTNFDHSRTGYTLEGKHRSVQCASCHKTKYTDPVRHERCTDCHKDYHQAQFARNGSSPDCSSCHTTENFIGSNYSIEKHNTGSFPLEGAHLATPCIACHQKENRWEFRNIGKRCADCHENIHRTFFSEQFMPESECKTCHSVNRWSEIQFDHSKTKFGLTGAHREQSCRSCHFVKQADETTVQKFAGLPVACYSCHPDKHNRQFEREGITECVTCHTAERWKPSAFDHNTARFKLDGKHQNVACNKCHKPVQTVELSYIQYKMEDIRCEACHK